MTTQPKPKRGGARPGAGRPRVSEMRLSISLTEAQRQTAARIGGGNVAAGIRAALDIMAMRQPWPSA